MGFYKAFKHGLIIYVAVAGAVIALCWLTKPIETGICRLSTNGHAWRVETYFGRFSGWRELQTFTTREDAEAALEAHRKSYARRLGEFKPVEPELNHPAERDPASRPRSAD